MSWLSLFRTIAFGVVTLFSLIVLGLSAHWISVTQTDFLVPFYFNYAALGIATALFTMVSVPAMFLIDLLRKGAFTSMIVVELSWLGTLWVFWLSTGALAAATGATFGAACQFGYDFVIEGCKESQAIEAFSFLNWLILLAYTVALLVVAIQSQQNGSPVWTSSVKDAAVSLGGASPYGSEQKVATGATPPQFQQYPYPPQPQVAAV